MGVCLAGASVTLTAQLFGVLQTTVFMIMTAYTNHGKTNQRRIVDENWKWMIGVEQCSRVSANFKIHLEDHVSTKTKAVLEIMVRSRFPPPTSVKQLADVFVVSLT